ncbi:MAG TPA: hypothetical protein PLO61_05805 [Fimbriimonadaceae bacterium]|nr:hypothetical protein [Fimbriimonadaceae bacterium]HRJ33367.1 hypothetical protein [Fimbriimonadaceae bacterium]
MARRLSVLILLGLTLGLWGCGGSSSPIVGTWLPYRGQDPIPNAYVTYRANGTMERTMSGKTQEGQQSMVSRGRWKIEGDKLTTTIEDIIVNGRSLEGLGRVQAIENMNLDNVQRIVFNGKDEFTLYYGDESIRHVKQK